LTSRARAAAVILAASTLALISQDVRVRSQDSPRRLTHTPAGATSLNPSISGDGRRVAFESSADLAAAGGSPGFRLYTFSLDSARLAQLAPSRAPAPALSQDGARAAFFSTSDPLGTNHDGNPEIYYFDGHTLRQLTETRPDDAASRTSQGCFQPSISDDGLLIAFASNRDLTGANADLNSEVFLYDVQGRAFMQLTDTRGVRGAFDVKLSGDALRVAFVHDPRPAGTGDDDHPAARRDLLVYERGSGATAARIEGVEGLALAPGRAISDDGQRVVYSARTAANTTQVFLYDGRNGGRVRRLTNLGARVTDVPLHPTLSGDGRRVAFATRRRVTTANSDGGVEVYVYDIPAAEFSRVTNAGLATAEVLTSLDDEGSTLVFNFPRLLAEPDAPPESAAVSEIFVAALAPRMPFRIDAAAFNAAQPGTPARQLAPGSLAHVTGGNLALEPIAAQRRAGNSFPTELLNTRVFVAGRAAELFYVSPAQVSFQVPEGLGAGAAEIVVRNHDDYETRASVTIAPVAPGLFTVSGNGSGEAVALDASTLTHAPFDATDSDGAARRLILFTTGLRYAREVTVTAGGQALRVEAVVPSPDLPGLEQVHVRLPARLRGAGTVPLVLRADGVEGNRSSLTFTSGGAPPRPARLSLAPSDFVLAAGGDFKLAVSVFDAEGEIIEGAPVSFSVSNVGVVAVDAAGVVRGLSAGEALVAAEAGSARAEARVRVETRMLVINEFLADPPDGLAGDANRDGVRDGSADEFVELVNGTDRPLDLAGWTLRTRPLAGTNETVRHLFAAGTLLPVSDALVIFGGGGFSSDDPAFGGAQVMRASSGALSLANGGLTLVVRDAAGNLVTQLSYGAGDNFGGDSVNQSITRSPDITGDFARHTAAHAPRRFSPGVKLDGSFFRQRAGRLARVELGPESQAVLAGGAAGFTARAFDQFERTLAGAAFSFRIDDESLALVESIEAGAEAGTATVRLRSLRAGTTQLRASATDGTNTVESRPVMLHIDEPPPRVARVEVTPGTSILNRGATRRLTAAAYDEAGRPVQGVAFAWEVSDAALAVVDESGTVRGVGVGEARVTATAADGRGGTTSGRADLSVRLPLIINEVLADVPPDDPATTEVEGDANRDGVRGAADDEFVEVVNASPESLDISGVRVSDAQAVRFTFPPNTTLAPGRAAVVFGGGNPPAGDAAFGGSTVFKASALSLNDTGDSVWLTLTIGARSVALDGLSYGAGTTSPAAVDQSLTRVPDAGTSTPGGGFVSHREPVHAASRSFSAGLRLDGAPFGSPPLTRIEIAPLAATLDPGVSRTFAARAYGSEDGIETEIASVLFRWDVSPTGGANLSNLHGPTTTLTARTGGSFVVRARAGSVEGTASLTVNPPPTPTPEPSPTPTPTPTPLPTPSPTPMPTPSPTPTPTPEPTPDSSPRVVISQVYGGGGNSGALFKRDFVELFNRGNEAVSLSGWTIQYASATGTGWQKTELSGVIEPGRYFLIQQAAGTAGTLDLPTPDASGSIQMAATAGKVILTSNTQTLSAACPTGATIVDVIGYGSTANCFEGTGPAPPPANTTAAVRSSGGCVDTDNNQADLQTAIPNPRNSSAPANSCGIAAKGGDSPVEEKEACEAVTPSDSISDSIFGRQFMPAALLSGVSGRRPTAGSTRWHRGASASVRPGTRVGPPRWRGAWP
jgi:uncharacterized protein (TIGR03437 family)